MGISFQSAFNVDSLRTGMLWALPLFASGAVRRTYTHK